MKKAKTAGAGRQRDHLPQRLPRRPYGRDAAPRRRTSDTSRVDTAQRVFLQAGNLDLNTPLSWKVYGDSYTIIG